MPPTPVSRTVNADPMAPDNPPGNHPIAAPITVVINGPMAPMTILSGDGSAILLPRSCRQGIQRERVPSLWAASACTGRRGHARASASEGSKGGGDRLGDRAPAVVLS
jgi:hypothetical protein